MATLCTKSGHASMPLPQYMKPSTHALRASNAVKKVNTSLGCLANQCCLLMDKPLWWLRLITSALTKEVWSGAISSLYQPTYATSTMTAKHQFHYQCINMFGRSATPSCKQIFLSLFNPLQPKWRRSKLLNQLMRRPPQPIMSSAPANTTT